MAFIKLLFCALIVGVAVCDALYDYDEYSRRALYRKMTLPQPTTTTESPIFMGKEYDGESAKKSSKYVIGNGYLSWNEASKNCQDRGMILANPSSPSEKRDFEEYLRQNSFLPRIGEDSSIWVGGHRISDGLFQWQSNKQMVDNGWLDGEPTGYAVHPYHVGLIVSEYCLELKHVDNDTFGWNDNICEMKSHFVCELVISDENEKKSFDNKKNRDLVDAEQELARLEDHFRESFREFDIKFGFFNDDYTFTELFEEYKKIFNLPSDPYDRFFSQMSPIRNPLVATSSQDDTEDVRGTESQSNHSEGDGATESQPDDSEDGASESQPDDSEDGATESQSNDSEGDEASESQPDDSEDKATESQPDDSDRDEANESQPDDSEGDGTFVLTDDAIAFLMKDHPDLDDGLDII